MQKIILLFMFSISIYGKDFSLIIEKPFESALFDIVEDYDRGISAIGFSQSYVASKKNSTVYTNAFDYLSSVSNTYGSQMHLIKINSKADIIHNKQAKLLNYNKAVSLVKSPQDGYYVGGYTLGGSLLISRIDSYGNILSTNTFGTNNHDSMSKLISLKDGGLLAIGTSTTTRSSHDNIFETGLGLNDIYVTRFSQDGKKIWSKKYGTKYDDKGIDAVESNDGSLIIVGSTRYQNHQDISLLRLTGNGDKIWLKHLKEKNRLTPYKLLKLRDNNFLLSLSKQNEINKEQIRLIKFNLHHDILIDKEIYTSYSSALKDIKEYSNGHLIGVGYVRDAYNTDALAMFLDANLNMINQEHFGKKNYDAFNAVTVLHNSQAVVSGLITAENSQESNMWITKLNRDGSFVQVANNIDSFYLQLTQLFKKEIEEKKLIIQKDLSIELVHPSLLFAQGKYNLSKKQKTFLNHFHKKLIPFLRKYEMDIQSLEVNGHTSSEWGKDNFTQTYLKNQKLSLNRAYATLSYIFKKQNLDTQIWLSNILRESGYAFSKQVKFNNRVENKMKSRRVSLKVILKH